VSVGAFLNNAQLLSGGELLFTIIEPWGGKGTPQCRALTSRLASEGNRCGVPNLFKYIFSIGWPSIN
jgi:hypothetical protein